MSLDAVITGLKKLIGDYPNHKIVIDNIDRCRSVCYILFNNYGVLNKYMAEVCDVAHGEMSVFRRATQISTHQMKLSSDCVNKILVGMRRCCKMSMRKN